MALNRSALFSAAMLLSVAPARADSPFRLQRLSSSAEAALPGALDEKKSQPTRFVNWQLENGTVASMNASQAAALDLEPLAAFAAQPAPRQKTLQTFAEKTLVPFFHLLRRPKGAVAAGPSVARAAEDAFPGTPVADNLRQLAEASIDPESNEAQIRGCVGRLNSIFHRQGLHLTFGRFMEFDGGTVELHVYTVADRLLAQINDRTVPVYVLMPLDSAFRVLALGMMEPYPPRIFVFSDMIALQAQDIAVFLRGDKEYAFEDPNLPAGSVPTSVQKKINQIVRGRIGPHVGQSRSRVAEWLLRCVVRHEGQHLCMDRSIKDAAESRRIGWEEVSLFHERQAYLFELETSEPEFAPFVLLASFSISAALSDKYSRVGCGAALRGLQKQMPALKFWDSDFNRPISEGLIPLFELPARDVKTAAGAARREVQRFLTSSSESPSAEKAADR